MKILVLTLTIALAAASASAQDMRPGIASIAVVTSEPDGRYAIDGRLMKPGGLKEFLVELDDQMAIGHVHLKKGQSDITPAQLAEMRRIADGIGAMLLVEKDGRMQPVDAPADPGA